MRSRIPPMRAFRLAYNGRPFYGFQRQHDVPTIEGTVFDALVALGVIEAGSKPEGYAAAGRTDRGVSAIAQTVAFEAPEWCSPRALNARLPASVRAWASAAVPDRFHATHDATARIYTYFLSDSGVDPELVRTALDRLSGTHDFHNLTPDDADTTRTLTPTVQKDDPFVVITLEAGGFARQLVRRVVSLVAAVARGDRPLAHIERVLSADSLSGPAGIGPAPPAPLVLTGVTYPDIEFVVDEHAANDAADRFAEVRADHETRARVADRIATGID
jgi:tRNA pseudouridine38-40 synthase